ncbi:hypothetical protein EON63_10225 [archaeon]|nr:MAG: hypothetical protein EON63_10225 [archaeon]
MRRIQIHALIHTNLGYGMDQHRLVGCICMQRVWFPYTPLYSRKHQVMQQRRLWIWVWKVVCVSLN